MSYSLVVVYKFTANSDIIMAVFYVKTIQFTAVCTIYRPLYDYDT